LRIAQDQYLVPIALTGYATGADVSGLLKQGDTALASGSYQSAIASYTEALGERS
jgi:hypothetical protein